MSKPTHDPLHVRVGQVWRDNDPRQSGRTFRIERIHVDTLGEGNGKAECRVLTHPNARRRQSATVLISLHRFRDQRNGYSLVSEPSVIGKSAEQRTRDLAALLGISPEESIYGSILRAFKEHARDQRHLCGVEVDNMAGAFVDAEGQDTCGGCIDVCYAAVLNAPEPGKG